jgi:hypothetical protein
MNVPVSHKRLDIYLSSKKLVLACYSLAQNLPPEEKANLSFYLRNAALKAHLALSQGVFLKKTKARQRLLLQAKTAFIIIDAVMDVLVDVGFAKDEETAEITELSSTCYQQVVDLLKES